MCVLVSQEIISSIFLYISFFKKKIIPFFFYASFFLRSLPFFLLSPNNIRLGGRERQKQFAQKSQKKQKKQKKI